MSHGEDGTKQSLISSGRARRRLLSNTGGAQRSSNEQPLFTEKECDSLRGIARAGYLSMSFSPLSADIDGDCEEALEINIERHWALLCVLNLCLE